MSCFILGYLILEKKYGLLDETGTVLGCVRWKNNCTGGLLYGYY